MHRLAETQVCWRRPGWLCIHKRLGQKDSGHFLTGVWLGRDEFFSLVARPVSSWQEVIYLQMPWPWMMDTFYEQPIGRGRWHQHCGGGGRWRWEWQGHKEWTTQIKYACRQAWWRIEQPSYSAMCLTQLIFTESIAVEALQWKPSYEPSFNARSTHVW